jgi:hypothetical protein
MFMSARNKDFFIFFAAAYITICINDALKSVKIKEGILRKALPASLTIILVYLTVSSGLFMQDEIASNPRYDRLKGAAQWLDQNVPPKSVIFNARWDFFPQIFFYNSNDYYYVAGIEPRFLYDYDNNLYWLWFNITNHGYVCDQEECDNIAAIQAKAFRNNDQKSVWYKNEGDKIADIIRKDFKSQYIISSVNYKDFEDIISNSDRFEKVYQDMFDGPFRIYKVN